MTPRDESNNNNIENSNNDGKVEEPHIYEFGSFDLDGIKDGGGVSLNNPFAMESMHDKRSNERFVLFSPLWLKSPSKEESQIISSHPTTSRSDKMSLHPETLLEVVCIKGASSASRFL